MFFKRKRWFVGFIVSCLFTQIILLQGDIPDGAGISFAGLITDVSGNDALDEYEEVSGNDASNTSEEVSGNDIFDHSESVSADNPTEDTAMAVSLTSLIEAETADYEYTGGTQTFTASQDAIYKLEVWGGQGASVNSYTSPGGKGGYSIGYVKLKKDQTLYITVGQNGNGLNGGYNGGGHGGCYGDPGDAGYGGGGCTHIAISDRGTLSNYASYKEEILIVAGGGGGQGGYSGWYSSGGTGGGLVGGNADNMKADAGNGKESIGGSQTSAGCKGGFGYGGAGILGNYNYGGGGGGWYGGGLGNTHAGGGGGSGYIGGVPEFAFAGETYSPYMENGVRSGNGYARITMMKKLVAATLTEDVVEILERKQVSLKAEVAGVVSYKWQIQKKNGEVPIEDEWKDINTDFEEMSEMISLENGAGTIELFFEATQKYSNYWFRICIEGEEENMESEACLLYVVPLKMEYLEVRGNVSDVEAGTLLNIKDIETWIIYNNTDIAMNIKDSDELSEQLYFVNDDTLCKQLLLKSVNDSLKITVRLVHEDKPKDAEFFIRVYDNTAPTVKQVTIEGLEYSAENVEKQFWVSMEVQDNSDSILGYWCEKESDGTVSEVISEGRLGITLNGNDKIKLYVSDASGNLTIYEKEILYVDELPPQIITIKVNPEKEWSSGTAQVTVNASDNLSGLHPQAYSFDGGNTWQESCVLEVEKSQALEIAVRDLVGNISDIYCVEVKKEAIYNEPTVSGKEDTAHATEKKKVPEQTLETLRIVSQIPYTEIAEKEAYRKWMEAYEKLPKEHTEENEDTIILKNEMSGAGNNTSTENSDYIPNIEQLDDPLVPKAPKSIREPINIPAVSTAVVVTSSGMFFMLFIFFRKADIFYINGLLQEEYISTSIILRRKNNYYVRLNTKNIEEIRNKRLCVRVSKRFARKRKQKYMGILLENKTVQLLPIKEKMYFYL